MRSSACNFLPSVSRANVVFLGVSLLRRTPTLAMTAPVVAIFCFPSTTKHTNLFLILLRLLRKPRQDHAKKQRPAAQSAACSTRSSVKAASTHDADCLSIHDDTTFFKPCTLVPASPDFLFSRLTNCLICNDVRFNPILASSSALRMPLAESSAPCCRFASASGWPTFSTCSLNIALCRINL